MMGIFLSDNFSGKEFINILFSKTKIWLTYCLAICLSDKNLINILSYQHRCIFWQTTFPDKKMRTICLARQRSDKKFIAILSENFADRMWRNVFSFRTKSWVGIFSWLTTLQNNFEEYIIFSDKILKVNFLIRQLADKLLRNIWSLQTLNWGNIVLPDNFHTGIHWYVFGEFCRLNVEGYILFETSWLIYFQ